jgi:DNA-binding response OmpR family regulator
VVTVDDPRRGIEVFRTEHLTNSPFGVVITDLGMPYLDGRAVARAIKEMAPTTPVILLTGWGRRLDTDEEAPPNTDHVLGKPPKLRELRAALAQCR